MAGPDVAVGVVAWLKRVADDLENRHARIADLLQCCGYGAGIDHTGAEPGMRERVMARIGDLHILDQTAHHPDRFGRIFPDVDAVADIEN